MILPLCCRKLITQGTFHPHTLLEGATQGEHISSFTSMSPFYGMDIIAPICWSRRLKTHVYLPLCLELIQKFSKVSMLKKKRFIWLFIYECLTSILDWKHLDCEHFALSSSDLCTSWKFNLTLRKTRFSPCSGSNDGSLPLPKKICPSLNIHTLWMLLYLGKESLQI